MTNRTQAWNQLIGGIRERGGLLDVLAELTDEIKTDASSRQEGEARDDLFRAVHKAQAAREALSQALAAMQTARALDAYATRRPR